MILFFRTPSKSVIATEIDHKPSQDEINELCWLYGDATLEDAQQLQGFYVGPRREMITPWSTNAVEITQNMSLDGISRIEEYFPVDSEDAEHDPMLQRMYNGIGQDVFTVNHEPEPIKSSMTSKSTTRKRVLPSARTKWLISTSWRRKTDVLSPTAKSSVSHRLTQSTAATRSSAASLSSTARRWSLLFSA